jgi:AcrR family transcriptional regulator
MRDATRERIVETAAELLAGGGREAVTTRAVATAAGVQPPTIYRLFGDKVGLLDAVTEHGFRAYLADKGVASADPVADLRSGWDLHVGFGLANPGLYALMYGDPRPGTASPAATRATAMLRALVRRIAEAGRLRVAEEQAWRFVHAAACGTVLTLLATVSPDRGCRGWPARPCWPPSSPTPPRSRRRGRSGPLSPCGRRWPRPTPVTTGERGLLEEWLDRIAAAPPP